MKPKVLAILPGFIPSTFIDVITPLIDLSRQGFIKGRIALEQFVREEDIDWCNLVILCRNTQPASAKWFLRMLTLRRPYIYDIDDNFFDIKGDNPIAKFHSFPANISMLKEFIRLAQLVRVYSEPMRERAQALTTNVIKVTAPVDWRLISPIRDQAKKDIIKIIYATSRSDDYLAEVFKPALSES